MNTSLHTSPAEATSALFASATFLETPLGAAVLVLCGVALMMFVPFVVALVKRARDKTFARAERVTAREDKPDHASLVSVALAVLARHATIRYPLLTPDEAMERYLLSEVNLGYYTLDQQREDAAKKAASTDQATAKSDHT